MIDRYPFDADGNLLPGLTVSEGRIMAIAGEAAIVAVEPEPDDVPAVAVTPTVLSN